jgi:carboxymethylenebutenolidase
MTILDVQPDGAAVAAVLVLHTIRGLNPPLVDICRRLAASGYRVIAPNLHHRVRAEPLGYDEDYIPVITQVSEPGVMGDIDVCLGRFAEDGYDGSRVAVVGFALGGSFALLAAVRRTLGAAVSFYASLGGSIHFGLPSLLDIAPDLQTPWLGLFPEQDPGTTLDEVDALRPLASKAIVPTEVVLYPGAVHGFVQEDRPDLYHEAAAQDSWARTIAWIERFVPSS